MLVLNFNFDYIDSFDNLTHQICINLIPKTKELITVHGFTKDEILNLFCSDLSCRIIKNCSLSVNTSTGSLHVKKGDDLNIYIIFYEYINILLNKREESKISLKNCYKIIESKLNTPSNKKYIKYFCIPKEENFWIKEYTGNYGNNIISYLWDGKEFLNKNSIDLEEIKTKPEQIKNFILTSLTNNIFLVDDSCNIDIFLKIYPNFFFKYIYSDFWNNFIIKYPEYNIETIVKINSKNDIKEQIAKKTNNNIPAYICIPNQDSELDFYDIYQAIEIL